MTDENADNRLPSNALSIQRLAEELKIQERKVIDFSASVNPLGVSKKVKAELRQQLKFLHSYPDTESVRLRKRIAQYYDIDPATILCGNGSTELLHLAVTVLRPHHVILPAPTYSGYERACLPGSVPEISYYALRKEHNFIIDPDEFIRVLRAAHSAAGALSPASNSVMAFLCNPNNPTGRLLARDAVGKIAEAAGTLRCYLLVDEAFIDFCPDESVVKDVSANPYLMVVRTMSHFYSLAGLRIGFGIFPVHIAEQIRRYQEPWTVNSLAQKAALAALKDKAYRKETLLLLTQEKRFLDKQFRKLGIEYFPSEANFYLLRMQNASEVYHALKGKGILLRTCQEFKGLDSSYLRIAVKSHKENAVLIKELARIIRGR